MTLVLTLRTFLKRQAQFTEFLSSNKSLTASRYFRLMALACMELMCTTPISVFQIYLNATAYPLSPWRSWADTHSDFGRVDLLPEVIWIQNRTFHIAAEVGRWAPVFCAMVFFAFFGFANECRNNYCKILRSVLVKCRLINEADCQLSTAPSGASKFVSSIICQFYVADITPQAPKACVIIRDFLFTGIVARFHPTAQLPIPRHYVHFRLPPREGLRPVVVSWLCNRILSRTLREGVRGWESVTRTDI